MFSVNLRHTAAVVLLVGTGLLSNGCSETVRQGRSPAYLIINTLEATSASSEDFSQELSSDVLTKGGIVEDLGRATFTLALKDVGPSGAPTSPSSNNFITITRYHVSFRRTDGRNTPGVDVPYAFDGAGTVTVTDAGASLGFVLVRVQAKAESPLKNLVGNGGAQVISTLADITFFGKDQTGSDVTVSGTISVNFADWADPS
jgi:hypothetical protein